MLDPRIYSDGSAWPLFRELRERAPIFRHPGPSDDGEYFWAVSNYAGCAAAFLNRTALTSEIYERTDGRRVGSTMFNAEARAHPIGCEKGLQHIDSPEHAGYQRVVVSAFAAKQVNRLRGRMREITRAALRVLEAGQRDFVEDIAAQVPFRILMDMIGIPADSRAGDLSRRISAAVFGFLDDEVLARTLAGGTVEAPHAEYRELILGYARDRRAKPRDDLLSVIDEAEFPDPEHFDIGRRPNRHLSLGLGLHRCLGLWLLKAEIAVILEETLAHFDDIELAGPPDRLCTVWVTGLKRLPIRCRASARAHRWSE